MLHGRRMLPDAPWGEHERFLEMTRLGWSILDQYGKAINLAGRADDADAASARALVASLLFSASDVARAPAHKHPRSRSRRRWTGGWMMQSPRT